MNIKKDQWLENILGKPVWMLEGDFSTFASLQELSKEGFATYKCDASTAQKPKDMARFGFELIDTQMFFQLHRKNLQNFKQQTSSYKISFLDSSCDNQHQINEVCTIASNYLTGTRFHKDERIDNRIACQIKSDWVKSYFLKNRGHEMVVAQNDTGQMVGFIIFIKNNNTIFTIDLIAVDGLHQGNNLGSLMMLYFLFSKKYNNVDMLAVGTQITNIRAIRLYEKFGFLLCNAQHVYHAHW